MNTFDEKLKNLLTSFKIGLDEQLVPPDRAVDMVADKLKALFEAETLEIIGEDEYIENEYYGGNKQVRDKLRNKQRAALREKLGKTKEQS